MLFCYADNYLQINIALIASVPKINTPLWINIWRISIFWIYTKFTVFGKRKSNLNFGASFIRFDQTLIPPESSFMNSTNNFPKISIQIFGTLANNHNKSVCYKIILFHVEFYRQWKPSFSKLTRNGLKTRLVRQFWYEIWNEHRFFWVVVFLLSA